MSDLSNLLGDVYGDSSHDAAPVRREPAAAQRAPEWASDSRLDEAFSDWKPENKFPFDQDVEASPAPLSAPSSLAMPGVDDDLAAALSAALAEPMPVTPPPLSVPEPPVQSLLRDPAPRFAPPAAPPVFESAPPVFDPAPPAFEAARPFSPAPVAPVPAPVVPMPVIAAVTAQPAERGAWTTPVAPIAPAHVVSAPVEQPQARYWVPGDDDITPGRKR